MRFLQQYIEEYRSRAEGLAVAKLLDEAKNRYDFLLGGSPRGGFAEMVSAYNTLGTRKVEFGLSGNPLRNLTGALLQDFLLSVVYEQLDCHRGLDIFTEAAVALGLYPLWAGGEVKFEPVSEKSDLAVGFLWDERAGEIKKPSTEWPRTPHISLPARHMVLPLIAISAKVRVSKPEFFDWLGRSQLMGKGNPHCLNIQVALRKEMRISIVQVANVHDEFFLIGDGQEARVTPFPDELERLMETISEHLNERMGVGLPIDTELREEIDPTTHS